MSTREIPRDQWGEFFNNFSRRHQKWPVVIEILDPEWGDQVGVSSLPFAGITAELRDGSKDALALIASVRAGAHEGYSSTVGHTVKAPRRVWVLQTGEDGGETLKVETERGAVLVRFLPRSGTATAGPL